MLRSSYLDYQRIEGTFWGGDPTKKQTNFVSSLFVMSFNKLGLIKVCFEFLRSLISVTAVLPRVDPRNKQTNFVPSLFVMRLNKLYLIQVCFEFLRSLNSVVTTLAQGGGGGGQPRKQTNKLCLELVLGEFKQTLFARS